MSGSPRRARLAQRLRACAMRPVVLLATRLATDKGFIGFDGLATAAQRTRPSLFLHGLAQTMSHEPRGLVLRLVRAGALRRSLSPPRSGGGLGWGPLRGRLLCGRATKSSDRPHVQRRSTRSLTAETPRRGGDRLRPRRLRSSDGSNLNDRLHAKREPPLPLDNSRRRRREAVARPAPLGVCGSPSERRTPCSAWNRRLAGDGPMERRYEHPMPMSRPYRQCTMPDYRYSVMPRHVAAKRNGPARPTPTPQSEPASISCRATGRCSISAATNTGSSP